MFLSHRLKPQPHHIFLFSLQNNPGKSEHSLIRELDDCSSSATMLLLPKRTYQPNYIKRKRTHGFFETKGGRKVIAQRIAKG
uniref:50S ribosomal protein L34 n=1 Tax=Nelumbo nucifera TaxID=4432 RepID=A0A822XB64_NELNU|nr:TPA_asm: hypothetical protein HUJ06_020117 [Nelumbo nucifera]